MLAPISVAPKTGINVMLCLFFSCFFKRSFESFVCLAVF